SKSHGEARVVVVASAAHHGAEIDFDDIHTKVGYGFGMRSYGRSKLANILFAFELSRQLEGTGVTVNALHPGFVASNFAANNSILIRWAQRTIGTLFALSPEEGARTNIYLASSPDVKGISGDYYTKCKISRPDPIAEDQKTAARLWQISEELIAESKI
ncbi:short-chain dehydrogenase, partial [Chloroflexota bacterium]